MTAAVSWKDHRRVFAISRHSIARQPLPIWQEELPNHGTDADSSKRQQEAQEKKELVVRIRKQL